MSLKRTILRNIARNRMEDSGIDHLNKRMGIVSDGKKQKMPGKGKKIRHDFWRKDPPVWRRILAGDLSKKADEFWKKESGKRARTNQAEKTHKNRIPGGKRRRMRVVRV